MRSVHTAGLLAAGIMVVGAFSAGTAAAAEATGPLRVHPDNPRYFTDGTKHPDGTFRALFLTGAHTWNNLADMGRGEPPAAFDFDAYLDFLQCHGHNFIRLWAWDSVCWDTRAPTVSWGRISYITWPRCRGCGPGRARHWTASRSLT